MDEFTPDWGFWSRKPTAEVWQCACLAMNINPYKYNEWGTKPAPEMLWQIREQALSHIEINMLPCIERHSDPHLSKVKLSDFAAWASGLGYMLPKEFPRQLPTRTVARWPWGDHETELLRKLAAAAYQWWSTYDPDQPNTAPTNEQVKAWLVEKQGVSDRVAETMATILRADGLPAGPRGK